MGEHLRRKQAQGFRHRYRASFDRARIPTLLSAAKPEVMTKDIRCVAINGTRPEAGDSLVLFGRGERIAVLSGNCEVATVAEDADLCDALRLSGGILRCRVRSVSSIAQAFVVRLEVEP